MNAVKKFYDLLYKGIMVLCKLLLIADIGITSMAVAGRYISFIPDPAWSEEIVLTCMIYMALISAALAVHRESHIRMTALDMYLPKTAVCILDIFGDMIVLIFSGIMAFVGAGYAVNVGKNSMYTSLSWLSKFWLYLPVAIAGMAILLFQAEVICRHIKKLLRKGGEEQWS
ncbi:MAG: TRAP transporter small permease [Lachnospiraceae bacterium]